MPLQGKYCRKRMQLQLGQEPRGCAQRAVFPSATHVFLGICSDSILSECEVDLQACMVLYQLTGLAHSGSGRRSHITGRSLHARPAAQEAQVERGCLHQA